MKLVTLTLSVAAITLGGGAWLAAATPTEPATVEYKFRESPLNALGIQSLEELRGKPVVIDFWGKN